MRTHFDFGCIPPGHVSYSGHIKLKLPEMMLVPNLWTLVGSHLATLFPVGMLFIISGAMLGISAGIYVISS